MINSKDKLRRNVFSFCTFLLILIFVLFSYGCAGMRILGEERKILENLAAEYYFLGEGYLSQKNYKKAIECFEFAMRDESLYQQAYYKKGYAAAMAKEWEIAEEVYKELLLQDEKNTNISISLAYIYSQQGKFEQANTLYVTVLQDNPYNKEVKENYIDILISMNNIELASTELESYKELFPDSTKKIDEYQKKIDELSKKDTETTNEENVEIKSEDDLLKEESI